MKSPDENPLLKEILSDEQLSAVRRASLRQGLDTMRRARRLRLAWRVGTLAVVPVLSIVGLMLLQKPPQETASQPPTPTAKPSVKIISDEELFALFPGRSLALIGKPPNQQLVSLDASGHY